MLIDEFILTENTVEFFVPTKTHNAVSFDQKTVNLLSDFFNNNIAKATDYCTVLYVTEFSKFISSKLEQQFSFVEVVLALHNAGFMIKPPPNYFKDGYIITNLNPQSQRHISNIMRTKKETLLKVMFNKGLKYRQAKKLYKKYEILA